MQPIKPITYIAIKYQVELTVLCPGLDLVLSFGYKLIIMMP